MFVDNVRLLLKLYVRPWAALSAIIDEGSFWFGLIAALLLSVALQVPSIVTLATAAQDARSLFRSLVGLAAGTSSFSSILAIAGLALLYVPAVILVMTLVDRRAGSFGVALARDYGQLAPCALMAWIAAHLPFLAASAVVLARPSVEAALGAMVLTVAGGGLYFAILMTLAVRLVYGTRFVPSLAAVILAGFALPFAAYLTVLASPFMLYLAYSYFSGDIRAIQWSLGSRRSFRRHLEAATINPRDGEAHYQLGLIHQHRRQYAEAQARFQKAIDIDRSEIDAHYQLGRIAREQGRHAEAIRHFEEVVARDPKHARHEVWREVGATYAEAGDVANARPTLERYVENRPYDPEGLCWLGLVLKRLGETTESRVMLERCIEATKTAPDYRKGELRHWRRRAQQEM
jgi:tetratricopeptide (TPR) repeat protein